MTKQEIISQLKLMENQHVFIINSAKVKNPSYFNLYFLKINDNKYLACDSLAGFIYGEIIPENYMTIEKVTEMIFGYFKTGFKFTGIKYAELPKVIG